MANIPPHYSDRFIVQRYNKALHFVQHLPASSNFQPTKNQKLELYALYKQVSEGNINTQRPGLFDVVGRAKWDAWKKLEGLSTLEARHVYVEALLRVATEAYKKNVGREEAQQIIHAFAIMRQSGEDDSSDDLLDTDDTSTNNEDEDEQDSSVASEDAEEQAYLRDIQQSKIIPLNHTTENTSALTRSRLEQHYQQQQQHQQQQRQVRPSSAASIQTMVTAPTTPRQLPYNTGARPPSVANSTSSGVRPRSALSSRLGQHMRGNEKKPHMTKDDLRVSPKNSFIEEQEFLDDNVNPWQQLPSNRRPPPLQENNSGATSSDSDNDTHHTTSHRSRTPTTHEGGSRAQQQHQQKSSSYLRLPSPMYQQKQRLANHLSSPSPPLYAQQQGQQQQQQQQQIHGMTPIHQQFQSPVPGSSTSSSVTTTPHNHMLHSASEGASRSSMRSRQQQFGLPEASQHITTVALGPATKRALESLQNEVIALNDRIDDLRKELVERDKQRATRRSSSSEDDNQSSSSSSSSDDMNDSWKWVIKAAAKYAGVNLMTVLIIFFVLYKSNSPIAFAILKQTNKFWQTFKLRVLISNVVV